MLMRANSHRSSQNSLEMHFQVDLKSLFLLLQSALNLIVARLQSMHFKKPAQRPGRPDGSHELARNPGVRAYFLQCIFPHSGFIFPTIEIHVGNMNADFLKF